MQRVGGREPMRRRARRASTTRSRTRARSATSCRSCAATSCAPTWTRSASAPSTCSTRSSSTDTDDPLLDDGFVYEMLLAHEHQHNETMLQLLQMVDGYEPSAVDARGRRRAGRRRARRWSRSRPGPTRSAPPPRASPTTTSAPATRSSWTRSRSIAPRSPTAPSPSSSPRPAPSRRCTGSATATAGSATGFGRREPLDPAPARGPRRLAPAPTPSPAGPASGCRPSSSGRRPPPGADRERANLDLLGFGCAAAGRLRRRAPPTAGAVQMLGDVWEWTVVGLRRLPGLQRLPLPRVLRGLLRRRLQGPARRRLGDAPRRDPDQLSQLGPAGALTDLLRPSLRKGRVDGDRRPSRSRSRSTCPRAGRSAGLAEDVREGLSCPFKEIPPKYFYDERGSELFEAITELPEYYPTRAERAILDRRRRPRSSPPATPTTLIELGSGAAVEDPLPARRDARARARSRPTSRSTSPRRSPAGSPRSWSPSTRACACTGSSPTTRPTSSASRARRAP